MSETEWLRSVGALTVGRDGLLSGDAELAGAEDAVAELLSLARAVPPCPMHSRPAGGDPAASCVFADLPAGSRSCALAQDLAALTHAEHGPPGSVPGDEAPARFLHAVRKAAPAVYLCRRVRHVGGHCWFRGENDLCGRILALAHRI